MGPNGRVKARSQIGTHCRGIVRFSQCTSRVKALLMVPTSRIESALGQKRETLLLQIRPRTKNKDRSRAMTASEKHQITKNMKYEFYTIFHTVLILTKRNEDK